MGTPDTTMGGGNAAFPDTAWSTVFARDAAAPERRAALNRLFARYWRPVYAFIRLSRNRPVDESKDLAQAFFGHLLESDFVSGYDRAKGRFRHYLKGTLRNFLAQDLRDRARLKRGGGKADLPLDLEDAALESMLADAQQKTPEEIFDREWYRSLMDQCIAALERVLGAEGPAAVFKVYERYELRDTGTGSPSYETIAADLGLTVPQVAHHLEIARKRLRAIVREAISEYALSEEEVRQEIQDLFST